MSDALHARLKPLICKPERRCLWTEADAITFTPALLTKTYGDGLGLFGLATIYQRPAYYVIRGDSCWNPGNRFAARRREATGDFAEHVDQILTDLEAEFGDGLCGYSGNSLFQPKKYRIRDCNCEDCDGRFRARWPMVHGSGGCSWWRLAWPETTYLYRTVKP